MSSELERVALKIFDERGYANVTIEEIAAEAQISVRTFYRYVPSKEDLLQVRIDRRSAALRVALTGPPSDGPLVRSVCLAVEDVLTAEDPELLRRWIGTVADNPELVRGVVGGTHQKNQRVIAEYLAYRLGASKDSLAPTMLAAAIGGVIQAALTHWYIQGGELQDVLSQGLELLEQIEP